MGKIKGGTKISIAKKEERERKREVFEFLSFFTQEEDNAQLEKL